MTHRIVIVEDHPVMRAGYVSLIGLEPDLEMVGAAATAEEALPLIETAEADVAIVDLQLPGVNGVELIKRVRALGLPIRILVVSAHEEELYAERALRAGAQGYLMKHESARYVTEAVRVVASGRLYLSTPLRHRLLGDWLDRDASTSPVEALSDREIEVFEQIGQGRTTREIAEVLGLSNKTIETHRAKIKHKLGIETMPALIQKAVLWLHAPML